MCCFVTAGCKIEQYVLLVTAECKDRAVCAALLLRSARIEQYVLLCYCGVQG